ncbi:MurR/RpiR family transcriptional regulator [Paenibacillus apiarius]|uniref:MurR/RpiR family transcriptional regulator n=1 Tax=Paenibacillus apiarius TaxID=46240 RepID=A0ABT4DNU9_9BACL|nr:MurR/RpiR family transcriptional regulator [Paenibacillus apiarius]MCY9512820.1 MurR/RpiR family transcriptional regulator [Paenibacillus apiarius]MCY9519036.1 MurR/RpiR family transcriptional regulator [Paenibacillus apiarius]MCY9550845.1 MurR/RpiR family transcriptional regulator [Paenibacillus apiarius]MCY9559721.1 MurR/RpiR family transcriptional regulator [Paenibacillus apiarius]MCY9681964.1 MurR/RpiR family transcriptional regulator [Paenibacillus apiarius]
MNGGLVRLREILDDITPSERKVAEFILQHPADMIGLSIAELARQSGGSQAAVIRLCKSMGFKGYQELMLKVAGDLQEGKEPQGYQEIRPHDSVETIIQNVSNNNIQSIRDTVKILDAPMVALAVEAMHKADRLYFFGLGASNLIAQDAQHKFLRINKTSFSFTDPHLQLTSSVMLTSRDAAIGISYSGETEYAIASLKAAREAGATTISITKYGHSTLSGIADIPLFISSTENEIRSGAMASRITQLNIIDILYLGVASRNYDNSVTYLEKSRAIIHDVKGKG